MKTRGWIAISGLVWLSIGAMLLYKGLRFIADGAGLEGSFSAKFANPERAINILVGIALFVGLFKGRFVLSKTVQRVVLRIISLKSPIRFRDVYTRSYYLLIGGMICLGMLFRFLPIPIDLRGAIDVAIGSALINGAMLYFFAAKTYGTNYPVQSP